ncbi:LOW QUALITY PROTEIN: uncharacterized protein LOC132339066 [Haemorhous mexicanus]|uniref:LOW QUALITY PROTEIN: uncharacterized protein LOC132339066 n=1 Tax=Haemorhous mexicanus TaxID=30427 RepID=UPI0028BEACF0|nr:LOW QUALITY PROTEIN: uncharacterized protein LOC132339066 [Haemorhous mexicanus]
MRRCRGAGLAALAALLLVLWKLFCSSSLRVPDCFCGLCSGDWQAELGIKSELKFVPFVSLAVAAVRGQVQQEPFLEAVEGTSISIKCSHPNIKTGDFIHFYRQLPGQRPELLAVSAKAAKEVRVPIGRMTVSADRRSSALWLAGPRRGDAAVYYCALGTRPEQPGLRPGTNRRGRGQQGALPLRPPGSLGSAGTRTDTGTVYGTMTDTGTGIDLTQTPAPITAMGRAPTPAQSLEATVWSH